MESLLYNHNRLIVKILLFFVVPFFGITLNYAQQKLLFTVAPASIDQRNFVEKNKIESISMLYQQYFVVNDRLDESKLEDAIVKLFPGVNQSGYAVIDWEGKGLDAIYMKNSNDKSAFNFYLKQFSQAISLAKRLRPNVKWSIYKLPVAFYKNDKAEMVTKNLLPLLGKLDFLCPSIYPKFLNPQEGKENLPSYRENVINSLRYGKMLNKPVYPFVWHRISPGKAKYPDRLLSINQFSSEIEYILGLTYQGVKPSGIVWWNSEQFEFGKRKKQGKIGSDLANVEGSRMSQSDFFQSYFNSISKFFK